MDNNVIFDGTLEVGRTPEQQFEFVTGRKFDKETMRVIRDPAFVNTGKFVVIDKTKNIGEVTPINLGFGSDNVTQIETPEGTLGFDDVFDDFPIPVEDLTDEELEQEIQDLENSTIAGPEHERLHNLKKEQEKRKRLKVDPEESFEIDKSELEGKKLDDYNIADIERWNKEALEDYKNSGYGKNVEGWYFNPSTDEYDMNYDPTKDSFFNKHVDDIKALIESWEKEALENYKNSGYGKNAMGWYFNPSTDEYEVDYDPTKDPFFNTHLVDSSKSKDPDKKDPDKKDPDQKDPGKKDPDQKDPGKKDPDQKDPDKKDPDQKDPNQKDLGNGWEYGGTVTVNLPPTQQQQQQQQTVQQPDLVKITFMNGGFAIPGYAGLSIQKGGTIKHGPVIDPVPLNKKGKPKKLTAKTFSHWQDQYGRKVDFTQPITTDLILSPVFKFDKKKAIAVGLGAAVGALAYAVDLAVPTPIPVVSMVGASATKISNIFVKRNLNNLTAQNVQQASTITAVDDIPQDLLDDIKRQKKNGYIATFLNTAAVACTISSAAQFLQNTYGAHDKVVNNTDVKTDGPVANDNDFVGPQRTNIPQNDTVKVDPIKGVEPPVNNVTDAAITNAPDTVTKEVLGGYSPDGQVFRSASDAMSGSNGLNPYMPAFKGNETFEAYNTLTGARHAVSKGEELSEILKMVGATDKSQVAMNVMSSDGTPLTWETLASMTEKVTKTI